MSNDTGPAFLSRALIAFDVFCKQNFTGVLINTVLHDHQLFNVTNDFFFKNTKAQNQIFILLVLVLVTCKELARPLAPIYAKAHRARLHR